MRQYTVLEQHLVSLGFTERYGFGLWSKAAHSTMVDTNSGMAKVYPHVDASNDNFVAIIDVDEGVMPLTQAIKKSDTDEFFINERTRMKSESIERLTVRDDGVEVKNEVIIHEMDGYDGVYSLHFTGTAESIGYDDQSDHLAPEDAYEIAQFVAEESGSTIRWEGSQPGWAGA